MTDGIPNVETSWGPPGIRTVRTEDREGPALARAKAGDREAFAELFVPHMPMLLAYSRLICRHYHTAQDVVQETALIAFRNLDRFFPDADFATWLKAIVRRRSLSAREKMAKGDVLEHRLGAIMEEAFADPTAEALSPERGALEGCLEALAKHDERSARLVREHYLAGQPLARMSELLSLNLNTLKTLLYRARMMLLDCVQRRIGGAHV